MTMTQILLVFAFILFVFMSFEVMAACNALMIVAQDLRELRRRGEPDLEQLEPIGKTKKRLMIASTISIALFLIIALLLSRGVF